MRQEACVVVLLAAALGCGGEEHNQTVAGPPLTITDEAAAPQPALTDAAAPADAAPVTAQPAVPASPPVSPITAAFLDVSKTPTPEKVDACAQMLVSVAGGDVTALGEKLKKGDTLVVQGPGDFDVKGKGLALVASWKPDGACSSPAPALSKKVVRANAAPELKWANGTLKAHLDLDGAPGVYLGRLEGTGPVAEHNHPTSWEVIAAVEASGTFTLDGAPQHLGPRGIVMVPPGVKHSWQPDAGSKLVAFQLYAPPGPEQRFKALGSGGTDAGAGADGGKK